MDLTVLKDNYVVFKYENLFRGAKVIEETPKKFEVTHINGETENIMKHSIVFVSGERDEIVNVLNVLNKKANVINRLNDELDDIVGYYKDQMNIRDEYY